MEKKDISVSLFVFCPKQQRGYSGSRWSLVVELFMTGWDGIPCYGAEGFDYIINTHAWLYGCAAGGHKQEWTHVGCTDGFLCAPYTHTQHAILIGPSLSSLKAKETQKVLRHTKINMGKQTNRAVTGHDENGRDQQRKILPGTKQVALLRGIIISVLPSESMFLLTVIHTIDKQAFTLFPRAQCSLLFLYLQHAWV